MLSHKEKAVELLNKMYDSLQFGMVYVGITKQAKECALIVVEELLNQYSNNNPFNYKIMDEEERDYWEKVKEEIINL